MVLIQTTKERMPKMNVLIAIDSFKGSLSSQEASAAVRHGVLDALPHSKVICIPVADGGEGTTEALIPALGGQFIEKTVIGPLGTSIQAKYGWVPEQKLAIVEVASAAGLTLVPKERRDPRYTTTYGFGELIVDALDRGCEHIILGLGGSATNDVGIGMLQALGYRFLDKTGNPVSYYGKDVGVIHAIDDSNIHKKLNLCKFEVASDVSNPLCGPNGASAVYAPQKGASAAVVHEMDEAIAIFARVAENKTGRDCQAIPGAGAAGGLGFSLMSFLNADLRSGITLIMDTLKFSEYVKDADIVFTGEGRLDGQTTMGKVPVGVAQHAKNYGKPVVALAGCITAEAISCNDFGIDAFFPIIDRPCTETEAMNKEISAENLRRTANQVMRLFSIPKTT